jgi:cyclopropane fatty-acyl-phospholipid synthase-like methyltransferase
MTHEAWKRSKPRGSKMSDFERWEKRYGAPGYLFGTAPNAFLAAQADRLRGRKTALSVADGEGRNGVWLAEQGLDVLAVDYSPTALAKAETLARERGVQLRTEVADLTRWRWPRAAFDAIAAIVAHFAGAERDAFFANLKNAL